MAKNKKQNKVESQKAEYMAKLRRERRDLILKLDQAEAREAEKMRAELIAAQSENTN